MAEPRPTSSHHVWRWHDEDPEAIVVLVLILIVILAVPWHGFGLSAVRGDARSVIESAEPAIREGLALDSEPTAGRAPDTGALPGAAVPH